MFEREIKAQVIDVLDENEVLCPDCHNKVKKDKLVCPFCSCPLSSLNKEIEDYE